MNKPQTGSELMAALDYVLNRCTIREIDALEAAVERRRRDLTSSSGIISLDPARAAKQMTGAVNAGIEKSMDGIKNTFRNMAADMIRKEAPELSEEQMNELIESWLPHDLRAGGSVQGGDLRAGDGSAGDAQTEYRGLAQKGLISGIPRDAMFEMVRQFVDYSTGAMPLAEESSLRDAVGDWTALYWKKFPRELQGLIRDFLGGAMTSEEFGECLETLLR
jgi:hypothetical protein